MTSSTPHPTTGGIRETNFVGLHAELCFIGDWLPRTSRGYANVTGKEFGGTTLAHRVVAALLLGRLAAGDQALHRCGNALCHNPHHLYVAGDAENQRDKLLHEQADVRWGPFGLAYPTGNTQVLMPQPLVLSQESSRLTTVFTGFTPGKCHHCDWLYPTSDGFRQLRETPMSGDVVGAHRRAYALFLNGPLDKYDIVSHICGDPTCLNPYHLVISGRQTDPRDFDVKHDKRFKLSTHGFDLIADFSRTAFEVAIELGIHPQTVAVHRADLRRQLRQQPR